MNIRVPSSENLKNSKGIFASAGTVSAGAGGGALFYTSPVRGGRSFLFSKNAPKPTYGVYSRELGSWLQITADTFVIVALSIFAGTAYQIALLNTAGLASEFLITGLVIAIIFAGIGRLVSSEHAATVTLGFDRFRDAGVIWSLAFSVLVFVLFALRAGSDLSRGSVLTFYVLGLPLIGIWRALAAPCLAKITRKIGYMSRECIVIGGVDDQGVDVFAEELAAYGVATPTILRFRTGCDNISWPREYKSLITRAINAAHLMSHGDIFLLNSTASPARFAAIQSALSILPRAIYVVPNSEIGALVKCKASSIGERIALEVRREPLDRMQRAIKRMLDFFVAAMMIVILAPFFAAVALAIKLDSNGPVLFRQTRNGYCGRPFMIFKFRSMRVQEDGPVVRQASRNDPRVTRVGRFLRKTSIDELPQLLNVLLGHMSLVGPRPHAQAHDELYIRAIENYSVRQHVKPGLTGWAQVNGLRGETATLDLMFRRIEYDLWYAAHASLLLDMEILFRTFSEVLRQRNAY